MKKRQTKRIILLTCLITAAVICFLALRTYQTRAAAQANGAIPVVNYEAKQVQSIAMQTQNDGNLHLYRDGEDVRLEGYAKTVDGSIGRAFIAMFSRITAQQEVARNPEDLEQYGLAPPQLVAEVTLEGGEKYTVSVGGVSVDGKMRYIMVDGAGGEAGVVYTAKQDAFSFVGKEAETLTRQFKGVEEDQFVVK